MVYCMQKNRLGNRVLTQQAINPNLKKRFVGPKGQPIFLACKKDLGQSAQTKSFKNYDKKLSHLCSSVSFMETLRDWVKLTLTPPTSLGPMKVWLKQFLSEASMIAIHSQTAEERDFLLTSQKKVLLNWGQEFVATSHPHPLQYSRHWQSQAS
jgi:hypothetical protein